MRRRASGTSRWRTRASRPSRRRPPARPSFAPIMAAPPEPTGFRAVPPRACCTAPMPNASSEPFDHFQNRLARSGEMQLWWRHPAIAEQGSHNGMFSSMLAPERGRARCGASSGAPGRRGSSASVRCSRGSIPRFWHSSRWRQDRTGSPRSARRRQGSWRIPAGTGALRSRSYPPPAATKCTATAPCPVALLSAGHGMSNGQYTFLARAMAQTGLSWSSAFSTNNPATLRCRSPGT